MSFVAGFEMLLCSLSSHHCMFAFSSASNELLQYKEKHGNCDVAIRKGFEEYKQLANWAGLQRVRWRIILLACRDLHCIQF